MKKLVFLLIIIHCFLSFSPKFTSGVYAMIDASIVIALAVCFLFDKTGIPQLKKRLVLYFTAFTLLIFFYFIVGYSTGTFGRVCFPLPKFFFSIFITMYCCENMNINEMKGLLVIIVLIASVNILYNIIFCTKYPYASLDSVTDLYFRTLNVGGTKFSHFSLSFFMLSFCGFLEINNKLYRIVFLLLSILSAYYIIQSGQRMTVIIFLFITIFILAFFKLFNRNIVILSFALTFSFIIMLVNFDLVLELFSLNTGSDRITLRLNSLSDTFSYGIDDDSFSGRLYYYKMSLETFLGSLDNFIFGVGFHEATLDKKHLIGIGGHSQILDILAMYGIIGTFLIFSLFRYIFKYIFFLIQNVHYRKQFTLIFLVFIAISLLKHTFDDHNSLLLFFALPLLYRIIEISEIGPNK